MKRNFRKPRLLKDLMKNKVIHETNLNDEDTKSSSSAIISSQLSENEARLKADFQNCSDIAFHYYEFGPNFADRCYSVHCETLVQDHKHNHLNSILLDLAMVEIAPQKTITVEEVKTYFINHGVSSQLVTVVDDYEEIKKNILDGHVVILFDHWQKALSVRAINVEGRTVEEPISEGVVFGPHEGTVENLKKNLGLLRSRLRNPLFKIETMTAGKETKTEIAYGYLEETVDPETLKEFKKRLKKLEGKDILETSFVEEMIEDSTYSPFPQYRVTERPDVAVPALLDGKIIVLVEGTASILICPALYMELFQSVEDYYQRTIISTMIRFMRMVAVFISLTLPSVYIALSTFHPEMIPTVLLLAVLNTREGIPFPALLEAVIMLFFFELMREAGIRMPRPIGQAVSIVGALIIGEAAIQAEIASPIMVVVVALTGISSFAIPQYNLAIAYRILQYPLMLLSATLGLFGLMIGLLLILLHLTSLRSLGQPYLAPIAPLRGMELRDVLIRAPLKTLLRSPRNRHMHKTLD